jgi:hypothetical protein
MNFGIWKVQKKRLFVGRTTDNNSGLFLYDKNGKPKMKIYVNESGEPKIEIIDDDANGKHIISLE